MRGPAALASAVVLLAGLAALSLGTDGWSVWTAESARRAALLADLRPLPDHPLRDSRGGTLSLADPGRPLAVVGLIYTRCPAVCVAMGVHFRRLQDELAAAGLLDDVQLLSVSFDPEHDDGPALAAYLRRFGAVEPDWRAARFEEDGALREVLDRLGVIVIPEPVMGFAHNAAYYLVRDGRVVAVFDVEDRRGLLEAIRAGAGA